MKLGEAKAAIQLCDKALKLDASCAKAYYRKASAYRDLANFDEAKKCFNKVTAQLIDRRMHTSVGLILLLVCEPLACLRYTLGSCLTLTRVISPPP